MNILQATKDFHKNQCVVEYAGNLLVHQEALDRERSYEDDPNVGSYLYFFTNTHKGVTVKYW